MVEKQRILNTFNEVYPVNSERFGTGDVSKQYIFRSLISDWGLLQFTDFGAGGTILNNRWYKHRSDPEIFKGRY
jgi:hypothetical protein